MSSRLLVGVGVLIINDQEELWRVAFVSWLVFFGTTKTQPSSSTFFSALGERWVKGSGVRRAGVGSSGVVSGEVVCVFVVEAMVVDVEDDGRGVIASSCWMSRRRPEMKQLSKACAESPKM
nr:hypothetical protein [Tanacetum cinerariifolium]